MIKLIFLQLLASVCAFPHAYTRADAGVDVSSVRNAITLQKKNANCEAVTAQACSNPRVKQQGVNVTWYKSDTYLGDGYDPLKFYYFWYRGLGPYNISYIAPAMDIPGFSTFYPEYSSRCGPLNGVQPVGSIFEFQTYFHAKETGIHQFDFAYPSGIYSLGFGTNVTSVCSGTSLINFTKCIGYPSGGVNPYYFYLEKDQYYPLRLVRLNQNRFGVGSQITQPSGAINDTSEYLYLVESTSEEEDTDVPSSNIVPLDCNTLPSLYPIYNVKSCPGSEVLYAGFTGSYYKYDVLSSAYAEEDFFQSGYKQNGAYNQTFISTYISIRSSCNCLDGVNSTDVSSNGVSAVSFVLVTEGFFKAKETGFYTFEFSNSAGVRLIGIGSNGNCVNSMSEFTERIISTGWSASQAMAYMDKGEYYPIRIVYVKFYKYLNSELMAISPSNVYINNFSDYVFILDIPQETISSSSSSAYSSESTTMYSSSSSTELSSTDSSVSTHTSISFHDGQAPYSSSVPSTTSSITSTVSSNETSTTSSPSTSSATTLSSTFSTSSASSANTPSSSSPGNSTNLTSSSVIPSSTSTISSSSSSASVSSFIGYPNITWSTTDSTLSSASSNTEPSSSCNSELTSRSGSDTGAYETSYSTISDTYTSSHLPTVTQSNPSGKPTTYKTTEVHIDETTTTTKTRVVVKPCSCSNSPSIEERSVIKSHTRLTSPEGNTEPRSSIDINIQLSNTPSSKFSSSSSPSSIMNSFGSSSFSIVNKGALSRMSNALILLLLL